MRAETVAPGFYAMNFAGNRTGARASKAEPSVVRLSPRAAPIRGGSAVTVFGDGLDDHDAHVRLRWRHIRY